jgi:cyclophilin family peptidyl-prolyl cis-trans isomerase
MAELRRTQQRRRKLRRGAIAAVLVALAVVLAIVTSSGGGSKKKVSTSSSTSAPSSSTTASTAAGAPTTTVAPLATAALDAALIPRSAPAHSAQCSAPATGTATSATTVPAQGNAVSIVTAPATVGFPALNGSSPRYTKFSAAPPFCIDATKTYTAAMQTDIGTITITLLPKYAPQTVNNFVFLAGYHYYDGTAFHRVIPGFMDQGGDPTGSGSGSPGYTIADEYPKTVAAYDNGAAAMANTGQPHTGGSQFFLVSGNGGRQLSPAYSVFGQITGGLSVAKQINDDGNSNQSANGVPPKVTHKIIKVTITES